MIIIQETSGIPRTLNYLATKRTVNAINKQVNSSLFSSCKYFYSCSDCINYVFADTTLPEDYTKNDLTYLFDRYNPNQTITYVLRDVSTGVEYALNNTTYGTYYGQNVLQNNSVGVIIDWSKVLTLLGSGKYEVITRLTENSVVTDKTICFSLNSFDCEMADGNIKMITTKNGYIEGGEDYRFNNNVVWGSNLRFRGKFEISDNVTNIDNLQLNNREVVQIQQQILTNYKLTLIGLSFEQYQQLITDDFMANDINISDFNLSNPDKLVNIDVSFVSVDEIIKHPINGTITLICTFDQKIKSNLKRNF